MAVLAALAVALFAVVHHASAAPALVVSINDSDNIVDPGGSNAVSFAITGDDTGDAASTWTVSFIVVDTGIVFNRAVAEGDEEYDTRTAAAVEAGTAADDPTALGTLIYPPNAEGDYRVTVRATTGTATGGDLRTLDGVLTITVGEAGDAIGSISVSLGKVAHSTAKNAKTDGASAPAGTPPTSYDVCTDADGSGDETDSSPGCVAVTVTVLNSLGEAANSQDISSIHLFAPLGTIFAADTATALGSSGNIEIAEVDDTTNTVGATEKFYVAKSTAGTVNVSAIILGEGTATSQALTLTFTGTANSIALGEPSSPLSQSGTAFVQEVIGVDANDDGDFVDLTADPPDVAPVTGVDAVGVANIEVTATDKGGNAASLTANDDIAVEVTDADGNIVESITANQRPKPNSLALIIEMIGKDAEPGTYTVTMSLGSLDEQSTEIVVAGKIASVEVEVSQSTVAIGDILTVTATVSDEDGNLQPDAGTVEFTAVGSLKLRGLGTNGDDGHAEGTLDDGVATGRFVVTDGSGSATIIASAGGVDGVTSVSTEAEEDAAPEAVTLDCLSSTVGFATYTCGVESSASELFALVSDRGATAIHLWNGSAWVRYSTVDGTTVPGSMDFTVTSNDILYVSN